MDAISALVAGDEFTTSEMFSDGLRAATADRAFEIHSVDSAWPREPFGPVAEVIEASDNEDAIIAAVGECRIALTQLAPFTERVLQSAPHLEWIGVSRGGPVNVNLDAATRLGIRVSFAPGRNAVAAAEYAIALMLASIRPIIAADRDLHDGVWRGDYYRYEQSGSEIAGSTVGLVGYGAIGTIVGRILRAMDAHVLVHDPYCDPERARADGVELVELDELLGRCRILSLHARLTPDTHHLLDAARLSLVPRGAVLVNTARGELVDSAIIPALLESGQLSAVALDVYEEEPLPSASPLLAAHGLIATPHLAGATRETAHRAISRIVAEAARFLEGRPLENLANPEVLARP